MNQKIAIVTGANIGLGFETTLGLVKEGIVVIMACRNLEKAQKAKETILKEVPNARVEIELLELNSLNSVREFAQKINQKYTQIDFLVNNAGIMIPPFSRTEEGFESQMGVNYFAHFLLTALLFPLLKNTEGARIISLGSIAHKKGKIDFENLNSEKSHSSMKAYAQSKLACLLFAFELQKRIEKTDSKVISVAVHPGVSDTNLIQHIPSFVLKLMPLFSFFMHSPKEAAKSSLLAILGKEVKGGQYYGPTGFNEMKGKAGLTTAFPQAYDENTAQKLWEISEKLVNQKFEI